MGNVWLNNILFLQLFLHCTSGVPLPLFRDFAVHFSANHANMIADHKEYQRDPKIVWNMLKEYDGYFKVILVNDTSQIEDLTARPSFKEINLVLSKTENIVDYVKKVSDSRLSKNTLKLRIAHSTFLSPQKCCHGLCKISQIWLADWNLSYLNVSIDLEGDLYMAKDMGGQFDLFEIYQTAPYLPAVGQKMGTWSKSDGLKIQEVHKYSRRANLTGVNLKIAAIQDVQTNMSF